MSGQFVSQGADTTGTVSIIAASDDQFAVVLRGFSTSAGPDRRLHLSPGLLTQGADGRYYVDSVGAYELPGSVDPADSEQVFFFPIGFWPEQEIRSVTIYAYAERVALGSAALSPAAVSVPGWASPHIAVADSGIRTGASGAMSPSKPGAETYVAVQGDTASDIASRFGVGLEQLIDERGIRLGRYPTLQPGDRILFGTPLTGHDYDCFFGLVPASKGTSCYDG